MRYCRPITGAEGPGAERLAAGPCLVDRVELLERGRAPEVVPVTEMTGAEADRLFAARPPICGIGMDRARVMGILNVTPDSFSDGGRHDAPDAARARVDAMVAQGAEIIDIGGESTRPGAAEVPTEDEIARVLPALEAARGRVVSIDTRKAAVAAVALEAGAGIVNDVSGLLFDPEMAATVASAEAPVILMHSRGTPETMADETDYGDVVLDVYDALSDRIMAAEAAGIPRARIVADPGIGFAKTAAQNRAILRRLSLLHGLGVPILLGASRKRFIGAIGGADRAEDRVPGSLAVALHGAAQGVQILRVHDVAETRQALALRDAILREDS